MHRLGEAVEFVKQRIRIQRFVVYYFEDNDKQVIGEAAYGQFMWPGTPATRQERFRVGCGSPMDHMQGLPVDMCGRIDRRGAVVSDT